MSIEQRNSFQLKGIQSNADLTREPELVCSFWMCFHTEETWEPSSPPDHRLSFPESGVFLPFPQHSLVLIALMIRLAPTLESTHP